MRRFCRVITAIILLACLGVAAEPADWIIRARYVLTMDPQHRLIENGAVAIGGDSILAVGPAATPPNAHWTVPTR